jgi:hypothetical protein
MAAVAIFAFPSAAALLAPYETMENIALVIILVVLIIFLPKMIRNIYM